MKLISILLACGIAQAGVLESPYTDPKYFVAIPFGAHSHWLQPWRAYLETVPTSVFVNGTGINFNLSKEDPGLIARMLAKNGFANARIEIGWGSINFTDESQINNGPDLRKRLEACRRNGIRPLILLNAHHGSPCPGQLFTRKTAAAVKAGDTKLTLTNVAGLTIGRSGVSNLASKWAAAECLITAIDGNTITLSKPLPSDIAADATVRMNTLKYRPFSVPGSDDYQQTVAAWQRYATTVARFTAEALGTSGKPDLGFDIEIWNELTFGSKYLSINNYYSPKLAVYEETSIRTNLVKATADAISRHPELFRGVRVVDGFGNTTPWPASSKEPERVGAISKHPYRGRDRFPKDEKKGNAIDALGSVNRSGWIPTYTTLFPEYYATAIQTETMVRDMGPITNTFSGAAHGRNARTGNPVATWMTEVNLAPDEDQPNVSSERAWALKAKATARYFAFFLNKGVAQLDLYALAGGDTNLGIVPQAFLDYAKRPGATYPADDAQFTSPALAVTRRMVNVMKQGMDAKLTRTRPLSVISVSDTHNHVQFQGDGTPAHPSLYNRDVLAILPYQANANRFVLAVYVMTRDVMVDLQPEEYAVMLAGVNGKTAAVEAYDPITDRGVPVRVSERAADRMTLTFRATDYPYLLTIKD